MTQVGAYEAKSHLSRLLDEVEHGASFTITRHGRPVARLIGPRHGAGEDLAADFAAARAGRRLGMPVTEAIAAGRR